MCGMLLESLQSCFPGVPCHVMDFGLSDARRKYFEEKKLLLDIPAGLSKTDHPYKLKSSMASFLNDKLARPMPIWIDCDMIAVRDGSKELFDLAGELVSQNKDFAIATDEGPNNTLEGGLQFLWRSKAAIGHRRQSVAQRAPVPERGPRAVFKSGRARKLADLSRPRKTATSFPIKMRSISWPTGISIAYRYWMPGSGTSMRGLLKSVKAADNEARLRRAEAHIPACDLGVSRRSDGRRDADLGQRLRLRGISAAVRERSPENPAGKLSRGVPADEFRNAARIWDILVNISQANARRNDPCPCGSGKKFKHCHGINA